MFFSSSIHAKQNVRCIAFVVFLVYDVFCSSHKTISPWFCKIIFQMIYQLKIRFGAFTSDERYIKKVNQIFIPGGLSSMIIFKDATFKKEYDQKPRNLLILAL
jgi:hypothetical protein